jgi:peptidoglycan/xylan/chitin deacetylase (PgdA/CDA1 family)
MHQRHSVTILTYHSVNSPHHGRVDPAIVAGPLNFERQVRYLARHTTVIPLERYIHSVRDAAPMPRSSVVITFDDGYKDNFTLAYPILRKYGLPATFFVATDYIGTGRVKWENRLGYCIKQGKAQEVLVESPLLPGGRRIFRIATARQEARAICDLVSLLRDATDAERGSVLAQLQDRLLTEPYDLDPDVMLSWDDVRTMAATPGISFGSHSASHSRLPTLAADDLQREIDGSKKKIEAEIGREVTAFSYPSGDPGGYDERVKAVLRASGYSCAATMTYGWNNSRSDLFELKRVLAPDSWGMRFGLGIGLRQSPLGEPLKRAVNVWKQLR